MSGKQKINFFDGKKPKCSKNLFNSPKDNMGCKQRKIEKEIFLDAEGVDLTTNKEKYIAEQKAQHISPFQKKLAKNG
jgi:hypothetical protein